MNRGLSSDLVRPAVAALALVAVLAAVFLLGPLVGSPPGVAESTYGYGATLDTNATLRNVTVYLPLPVSANGSSPVAAAIERGDVDAPEGMRYGVAETEHGRVVTFEADELPAERQPDGRRYSVHQFGVHVPAGHVIDTGTPYGSEPTIAPTDDRIERPCPNQAGPDGDPGETCYDFDGRVYVSYDAPPDAEVGLRLVHNGVNSFEPPRRDVEMYYERLFVGLRGPQDGWRVVDGFASTEGPRT